MNVHDSHPEHLPSEWVVRSISHIREGGTVLDLACGRGRHTRLLLARGFRVVAVDLDVSGLDALQDDQLTVVEADLEAEEWPLEGRSFDGIVVTNYLYRPRLVSLVDLLTPGAVLIYETFTKGHEAYGRPTNPNYLLDENELRETFAPHLEILAHEHHLDPPPRQALRQRLLATKR